PRSEKSAVFWEIGISWPSQNAHPVGGKLNGKMRISATNWSDMLVPPQVWLGKTPNREMMKLMQRNGCVFSCGWLPPAGVTVWLESWTGSRFCTYASPDGVAGAKLGTGLSELAMPVVARKGWVWLGICCTVSVSCSVPAISPSW